MNFNYHTTLLSPVNERAKRAVTRYLFWGSKRALPVTLPRATPDTLGQRPDFWLRLKIHFSVGRPENGGQNPKPELKNAPESDPRAL